MNWKRAIELIRKTCPPGYKVTCEISRGWLVAKVSRPGVDRTEAWAWSPREWRGFEDRFVAEEMVRGAFANCIEGIKLATGNVRAKVSFMELLNRVKLNPKFMESLERAERAMWALPEWRYTIGIDAAKEVRP